MYRVLGWLFTEEYDKGTPPAKNFIWLCGPTQFACVIIVKNGS